MWVMVTDVQTPAEARKAFSLGVNAIGLLPGITITPEKAKDITESLPKNADTVLVTHLRDPDGIIQQASRIGVSSVELCDAVSPEQILEIKKRLPHTKIIKAIGVDGSASEVLERVKGYLPVVDLLELDTVNPRTRRIGGTGRMHDWNISREVVEAYGGKVPIILAGGLTAANVKKALRTIRPFGVNVSTGIQTGGVLDPVKLKKFLAVSKGVLGFIAGTWAAFRKRLGLR